MVKLFARIGIGSRIFREANRAISYSAVRRSLAERIAVQNPLRKSEDCTGWRASEGIPLRDLSSRQPLVSRWARRRDARLEAEIERHGRKVRQCPLCNILYYLFNATFPQRC
jgi:hypothetical protein